MKLFALTITLNRCISLRTNLDDLKLPIQELLDCLHDNHYCTGHLGYEFQKNYNRFFHVHVTIYGEKMPYFKHLDYSRIIRQNKLNVRCEQLKTDGDIRLWTAYTHKEDSVSLDVRFANILNILQNAEGTETESEDSQ